MAVTHASNQQQPTRRPSMVASVLARLLAWVFRGGVACVGGVCRVAANPVRRRYVRHYHPTRPHARKHLIADIAFVVAILALVVVNGYMFFSRPRPMPSKVQLAWTAEPATVRAGDRVTFTLAYMHTGIEDLRDATLALRLPERFTVESVNPGTYDPASSTVRIGVVATGASGQIVVRGTTDAADGSLLRMESTFHGQGATTVERVVATGTVEVHGVAIDATLAVPPFVPQWGTAFVELTYTSVAAQSLQDVMVAADTDAAAYAASPLRIRSSTVVPSDPQRLAPGASGTVRAVVDTQGPGDFPLRFSVLRMRGDHPPERLGTIEQRLTVRPFEAHVDLTADDRPTHLGRRVPVSVRWVMEEVGVQPTPVGIRLAVAGPIPVTLTADDLGVRLDRGTATWEVPIRPRERGEHAFMLNLPLPRAVDSVALSASDDANLVITLAFVFPCPTTSCFVHAEKEGAGSGLRLPIIGELKLAAFARYFSPEGDQLGRGSLPPRVGKPTKYWLTWDVRSLIEAADRVVVRATLPEGVEWTGKTATTAGDQLIYDPGSRTVTWAAGAVERTSGKELNAVSASFEVAFVPRDVQVGTFASLLGATHVDGAGRTTSETMSADAAPVTTELPHDAYARGKGRVVR